MGSDVHNIPIKAQMTCRLLNTFLSGGRVWFEFVAKYEQP